MPPDAPAPETLALLRGRLLSGLPEAVAARLGALARLRDMRAGAVIFRKGDPGNHLYLIQQGRVRIVSASDDGREVTLNLLGAGDLFGEVAFADGGPRTADAVAADDGRLVMFDRRELLPVLRQEPEILLNMLAELAARARWISQSYEDTAFRRLPSRLARRLLVLSTHFGVDSQDGRRLAVTLRHQELASHMNVTRESISRLLQAWRRQGLIDHRRGQVTLKDIARLERISAAD